MIAQLLLLMLFEKHTAQSQFGFRREDHIGLP